MNFVSLPSSLFVLTVGLLPSVAPHLFAMQCWWPTARPVSMPVPSTAQDGIVGTTKDNQALYSCGTHPHHIAYDSASCPSTTTAGYTRRTSSCQRREPVISGWCRIRSSASGVDSVGLGLTQKLKGLVNLCTKYTVRKNSELKEEHS